MPSFAYKVNGEREVTVGVTYRKNPSIDDPLKILRGLWAKFDTSGYFFCKSRIYYPLHSAFFDKTLQK
jgi:hypothetical protein